MPHADRDAIAAAKAKVQGDLSACDAMLEAEPHNAALHKARAKALLAPVMWDPNARPEGAILSFTRAIELDPNDIESYLGRAVAKSHLGRAHEAVEDCDRAIRLDPRSADAHRLRGSALAMLGRHAEALADFEFVLEMDNGDPEAHCLKGVALVCLGRYAEAIDFLNLAMATVASGDPRASLGIAMAMMGLGRHAEALDAAKRALSAHPDSADLHTLAAHALAALGRHGEALESVNRILAMDPGNVGARIMKAYALFLLGRHGEALGLCDGLALSRPDNAGFHLFRAILLAHLGRHPESLAASQAAFNIRPADPMVMQVGGMALHNTGFYREALETAERALAKAPQDASLHVLRAHALHSLARPEEAVSECDRAILMDPVLAHAHTIKGAALLALGRSTAALESFRHSLSLDPDSAHTHLGKGMALRDMGLHAEAQRSFDRALELDHETIVPPWDPPEGGHGGDAAAPAPAGQGAVAPGAPAMGINQFECPKCKGMMINDLMYGGYRCFACGNHEPLVHSAGGGAPGRGGGAQAGTPGAGGRAAGPSGAEQGMDDIMFHPSTLGRLASILCVVYRNAAITDLLRRSGLPPRWNYFSDTDWRFLYGCLERIQQGFGPYGVARILKAACSPQEGPGRDALREEINACLSSYGLRVGKDGVARHGAPGAPGDGDAGLLERLGWHPAVMEHAGPKFLKGEYHGAVAEGCKALEGVVRKKSGIDGYGARLMRGALGSAGILEVGQAGLTGATMEGRQRGLEDMCTGMVSCVRNPASHEHEASLGIGRDDALHILGTISYLCGQVEGMERRQESGMLPQKGGKRGPKAPAEKGPGTARPVSGDSNGGDAGLRAGGEPPPAPPGGGQAARWPGQPRGSLEDLGTFLRAIRSHKISEVAGLAVRPETVEAGGTVDVTVTGTDIGEWYVWVCAEDGTVKSIPTPLEARDPDASTEGGVKRYAFSVRTVNYDPGEYRVSVSVTDDMSAYGVRIKKFMVTPRRPAVSDGGKTAGTL